MTRKGKPLKRKVPAPAGFYGCVVCLQVKPVADFHRTARGPDGHSSFCKVCKQAKRVAYRERMRGKPDPTITERFWPKVSKDGPLFEGTPCWVWTGAKSNRGYGAIFYQGADHPAHRVSMELHGHAINYAEQVVDHRCRNIACVNPAHLRICTQLENVGIYADRSKAGDKMRAFWDSIPPEERSRRARERHARRRNKTL